MFLKKISHVQLYWEGLSTLVELWHPQAHTFIFQSFEATILVEEVEELLGFRTTTFDSSLLVQSLGVQLPEEVFQEFMDTILEMESMCTPKGIDMHKFVN